LTELEQEDVEAPRPIEKVVSLKNVSKEYSASGKKVKALDDISFDVKPKELVVLLGPSGAGKTTILNLIAGLEKPTSGEVRVLDIDLVDSDENFLSSFRAANIGFVFQSYNLVSTLTARENVELMMELAGWSDANRNEKRTAELIESVGLTERADHLPAQLSGGEQQRVAIARALANDPQLILADEPTGNLDIKTGSEIVTLLEGLKKERDKTVIITTHDERIVQKADTIYRVERGRLIGRSDEHKAGA
jgi:putative ABC transport system ATP-binding protein